MFILAYSIKSPTGLRDLWETHETREALDKAYENVLRRDRLHSASVCAVLKSIDYDPAIVDPVKYSNETVLASGGRIVLVKDLTHSGWLYHDADKTSYLLYRTLQAYLSAEPPFKVWDHDSRFNSFEEEVIEHWLMTGTDIKEPT